MWFTGPTVSKRSDGNRILFQYPGDLWLRRGSASFRLIGPKRFGESQQGEGVGIRVKGKFMTALKNALLSMLGMVLLVGAAPVATWSSAQSVAQMGAMQVPYYAVPAQLDLCGEPVPLEMQEIRERFDREFTIVVYSHAQVFLWLKRAERFFPWIEKQLCTTNYPVTSSTWPWPKRPSDRGTLQPGCGPWQFIPSTGANTD